MRPAVIAKEREEFLRAYAGIADLSFVSTLDTTIPWDFPERVLNGFDALIIAGSGDFYFDGGKLPDDPARQTAHSICARLKPLICYCVDHDVPTLGICFGHQLIAEVYGGEVRADATQAATGTYPVTASLGAREDRLLKTLPEQFFAQYGHKDSVTKKPEHAQLLVSGERCMLSGLQYGNNVYTFQFHPELDAAGMLHRLSQSPEYVAHGAVLSDIVRESPEAKTLLPRFAELIAR
jgi:GMP synthase (glutamine-hydrolysing)